jgi:hypothetical protein
LHRWDDRTGGGDGAVELELDLSLQVLGSGCEGDVSFVVSSVPEGEYSSTSMVPKRAAASPIACTSAGRSSGHAELTSERRPDVTDTPDPCGSYRATIEDHL